jgi:hypothetical protein
MKCNIKVLYDNVALAALKSGRKYDVKPQNGDCNSNVSTFVFETKSVMKTQSRYRIQHEEYPRSDNLEQSPFSDMTS